MEIRDLMYLDASATAGNFTRAAESLGVNSSTISRRVGRFEDELGLALFERGHAGVRLTSGGKAVMPHIRRALAELYGVEENASHLACLAADIRAGKFDAPGASRQQVHALLHALTLQKLREANPRFLAAHGIEIGRASCWERV